MSENRMYTNICTNESRKGEECQHPAFSSRKMWCRWCGQRLIWIHSGKPRQMDD